MGLVGRTLMGRYRVDAFIASGGMGAVYKVWDQTRSTPLAMKVLYADLAEDPILLRRFEREARALKKLAHPHIVPFYGLFADCGSIFLLEHFIDGPTLKEILQQYQGKPMTPQETLPYIKVLSSALGYAHANGVIHCDVKPGNVLVEGNGKIYLTDFGVARHMESTTTTFGAAGTPAYMAPEQIRGEALTPAADIYALGVLLFEMVTGQRPFRGEESESSSGQTAGERIREAHLNQAPPDPRSLNQGLSSGLANVILCCLAKNPQERYDNSNEFFTAVCQAVGKDPKAVGDQVYLGGNWWKEVQDQEFAHSQPPLLPISQRERRKALPWLGLGILAIGAILTASVLYQGRQPNQVVAQQTIIAPLQVTKSWTTLPSGTPDISTSVEDKFVSAITPSPILTNTITNTVTPTHTAYVRRTSARVLWDSSHGPRKSSHEIPPEYDPGGVYSSLAKRMHGINIQLVNSSKDLNSVDLTEYQAVVVNEWSSEKRAYTNAEADLLDDFVRDGGGLLILADHSDTTRHVMSVCEQFSVVCYQSNDIGHVTSFGEHSITQSVRDLMFGFLGGALSIVNTSTVVGTSNGHAAIIALENLPGRVVIIGDGNIFDNDHLNQVSDSVFADNVFNWITRISD